MQPIAAGFLILVGTAAFLGVVVGAIGGAVVWRRRCSLLLGGALTACGYLLVLIAEHHEDFIWLPSKLTWGIPSMTLAFLICSVSASWLESHTTLRPTWIALSAFGISLGMGFLYLFLFRLGLKAPLVAAIAADICLILMILVRNKG